MDIIKKVKALNLPLGKYAVFGSGALAVRGIRESEDIDLVVTPEIYKKLKIDGWKEEIWPSGRKRLSNGSFEVSEDVDFRFACAYNPDIIKVLSEAEIINGIPFVSLDEIVRWKKAYGRDKDKKDLKLIGEFLQRSEKK